MLNLDGPMGELQFEQDPSTLPDRDLFRQAHYLETRVSTFDTPSDDYDSALDFTGLQSIGSSQAYYHTKEDKQRHEADIALLRRTCAVLAGKQNIDEAIRAMAEEDYQNPKILRISSTESENAFVARRIHDVYHKTLRDLAPYMPEA